MKPYGYYLQKYCFKLDESKILFLRDFLFRCPKSAKNDRKWAAYSEARKLNSKTLYNKLIARRILTFFPVHLEPNRSRFDQD